MPLVIHFFKTMPERNMYNAGNTTTDLPTMITLFPPTILPCTNRCIALALVGLILNRCTSTIHTPRCTPFQIEIDATTLNKVDHSKSCSKNIPWKTCATQGSRAHTNIRSRRQYSMVPPRLMKEYCEMGNWNKNKTPDKYQNVNS